MVAQIGLGKVVDLVAKKAELTKKYGEKDAETIISKAQEIAKTPVENISKPKGTPFLDFVSYIQSKGIPDFYGSDQSYLHAMLKVCNLDFRELHSGWNSYIHYIGNPGIVPRPVNDERTKDTKFVHIQLRAADHFSAEKLYRITNEPQTKWDLDK